MYHPVRLIGKLITVLENGLRKVFPKTEAGERTAGRMLVILVCSLTTLTAWILLKFAYRINFYIGFALECMMCYQLFAVRSLKDESMKVYDRLKAEDLLGARKAVSMIVGRDTQSLTAQGVTKAAVETIAENTSDGTMAPLLFMFLGGPIIGWFYKAVNTMDSMVGYKNDQYLYFGRCAAKFDDLLNYIPARLCGCFMVLAAYILRHNGKHAWQIFKRDRYNHASPNSAQTEAVMAGALDVQLAGDAWYFGKRYEKPPIGDDVRPIECYDIVRANRLLYTTALVAMMVFSGAVLLIKRIMMAL